MADEKPAAKAAAAKEEEVELTAEEKLEVEKGEALAEKLVEEQEARPDDHELVVAAEAYNDAAAAAEENPPVPVEEAEEK
jgi:hypothetical protein